MLGPGRVFGLTLLERLILGSRRVGVEWSDVRIELPATSEIPGDLPEELSQGLRITWSRAETPLGQRLEAALREAPDEPLLALPGDAVVDGRLLAHFAKARGNLAFVAEGPDAGLMLRLEGALPADVYGASELSELVQGLLASGHTKALAAGDFDAYIVKLRRELPPYAFRIGDDESRARIEHFLFW